MDIRSSFRVLSTYPQCFEIMWGLKLRSEPIFFLYPFTLVFIKLYCIHFFTGLWWDFFCSVQPKLEKKFYM